MLIRLQLCGLLLLFSCIVFSQDSLPHFNPNVFEQFHFAHRGGYANGPENTLKTILGSIQQGVNAIEIDVELTKDDQLVLFHDETINRVLQCDTGWSVTELSLAELKSIPLRDTTQGVQYVCSFRELIDTLVILIPNSRINDFILEVDFKPHGDNTVKSVDALSEIINAELKKFGDRLYNYFFISTFYPEVLKQINRTNPKIVTAFAVHNSSEKNKLLSKLAILFASTITHKNNVKIIEPNICMINDRFVKKWHKKGSLIITYTANTECQKDYVKQFPVAYTTDCPNDSCAAEQYGKPKKWCKQCNSQPTSSP